MNCDTFQHVVQIISEDTAAVVEMLLSLASLLFPCSFSSFPDLLQ